MSSIVSSNSPAIEQYFSKLYQGYKITKIDCQGGESHLYLEGELTPICPDCGTFCSHIHQKSRE